MINILDDQLEIILNILKKYVPHCEVRAFGSRINGTHRHSSDLDLAIAGKERLSWQLLESLKEAFEESNLPFRVDVLDWHAISPEFQSVTEKGYVVIQSLVQQIESD